MKTQQDVETDLTQTFVSLNSNAPDNQKITSFVLGSVIRSIFSAIAGVVAEMWNDLTQFKRKAFIETATGSDLDTLAGRRGMTRGGANGSSVIVVITGTIGTVIPQGTQVVANSKGIIFSTKNAITIGSKNNALGGASTSTSLGDSVIAESTITGQATNVPANTVNALVTPIVGVTGVNNPTPSQGGVDTEPDDLFAIRIRDQVSLLNQGTQAFFEALAQVADTTVLRAQAVRDTTNNGIKIYLVKNSGGTYSGGELTTIATAIAASCRSTDPITCVNASLTTISIAFSTTLSAGAVLGDMYVRLADAIANFIDWRHWQWGQSVLSDDLVALIKQDVGIANLDLTTFTVNGGLGDVGVAGNSLPYFAGLSITNSAIPQTITNGIVQSYPV